MTPSIANPPTVETALLEAVRRSILAPSSHNTQPWLFRIGKDFVEIHADRRRSLPVVDPEDRELVMSCGAALFNLRLGVRHAGYAVHCDLLAEHGSGLLARVSVGQRSPVSSAEEALFQAILRRRTNRRPFEDRAIPPGIAADLETAARAEGALLTVLDSEAKYLAAELAAEGDRIQAADPEFRRELAAWVHSDRAQSNDGIPAGSFGVPAIASFVFPLILRTFDWGDGQAAKDRQLAEGSPMLAVLSTSEDGPRAWLEAGQGLERVLLTATAAGLSASFLNQPIEVSALRPRLAALAGIAGKPQLLLRIGYGSEAHAAPRRPLSEVLMQA